MSDTNTAIPSDGNAAYVAEVQDELRRILCSERFSRAEGLKVFLGFIVERTLQGHGDELKESVIAIDAFNKGASFDPRLDAFVRVQAGRLRTALAEYFGAEGADDPILIEIPKGSYTPVFVRSQASVDPEPERIVGRRRGVVLLAGVAFLLLVLGLISVFHGRLFSRLHPASRPLSEKDTIVVAGFDNSTGDPVFDGTIRQALLMDLDQTPFLNVLPEREVQEMRRLMTRPLTEPFTLDQARELCQRAGGKAVLTGSIASLGRLYVIGMTATNCASGEAFIHEQVRAEGKEQVLQALDQAVFDLRGKLGESLANLQKYNLPLERVTTPSLKALQAYSQANILRNTQGDPLSLPYFQRAIELDPAFAMAYNRLGGAYYDLMQFDLAAEMFRKAYALRDRVSQRERYYIESRYHQFVAADLDKALRVYLNWQEEFPGDSAPYTGAGTVYLACGDYEHAIKSFEDALQRDPHAAYNYTNLAETLLNLSRSSEARQIVQRMQSRKLEEVDRYIVAYQLAFLDSDAEAMRRLLADSARTPEANDILEIFQAQTEAGRGRMNEARRHVRQAVNMAVGAQELPRAAIWQAQGALFEAEFVGRRHTEAQVQAALHLSRSRDVLQLAALALARSGDVDGARKISSELMRSSPDDTILLNYWLPCIDAAIDLQAAAPDRAIARLKVARSYELGQPSSFQVISLAPLYPILLRGEALLKAGSFAEAEKEFDKLLMRSGMVQSYPLTSLARLERARALNANEQSSQAAAAYHEILSLWKDADPELALLQEARREAARIHAK
jgi:tetratricopeptide (TPR) repeat protein